MHFYIGAPKVQVTRAMKHLQEITESGQQIFVDEPVTHVDYSAEKTPVDWNTDVALNEKYSFVSELARYVIISQGSCKTKTTFLNLKIWLFLTEIYLITAVVSQRL
jgi:hypothetical protein